MIRANVTTKDHVSAIRQAQKSFPLSPKRQVQFLNGFYAAKGHWAIDVAALTLAERLGYEWAKGAK